jgi:hypothetical protein
MGQVMPTGLKATSSNIAVGFGLTESAVNTFTQAQVDLNLSPLDREVFVVLGINLDPVAPEAIANLNTSVRTSLTTTSQTAVQQLSNSNCMATSVLDIRSDPAGPGQVPFVRSSGATPIGNLDYIGIIATNDFFVQITGANNTIEKSVFGKLYGYRARASADIYAALVQSEVLSA